MSPLMTYGGVAYGGEPDCTARNIVIGVIVLYLLYVYVFLPSQNNGGGYDDGSSYYRDYFMSQGPHYYPTDSAVYYDSSPQRIKHPNKTPVATDFLSNLTS